MASTRPVVFITGAAGGGIGTTSALRFAKEGYNIVATDIVPLESVKIAIEEFGVKCLALRMDVCSSSDVEDGRLDDKYPYSENLAYFSPCKTAVKQAISHFGRIDCLVNNAARSLGSGIHDVTEENWNASITLTLTSVFLVSKAIIPQMLLQSSGGVIINISSVNGQSGIGEEAYSASKAGVINLTQNMAVRYGPHGIRANCIAPGTIETSLWKERLQSNPGIFDNLKKYYPLERLGRAEDVANAVWFLASKEASWITGVTLNVDGGLMAGSMQMQKDLMGD